MAKVDPSVIKTQNGVAIAGAAVDGAAKITGAITNGIAEIKKADAAIASANAQFANAGKGWSAKLFLKMIEAARS